MPFGGNVTVFLVRVDRRGGSFTTTPSEPTEPADDDEDDNGEISNAPSMPGADKVLRIGAGVEISSIMVSPFSNIGLLPYPPCSLGVEAWGELTLKPVIRSAMDSESVVSGEPFIVKK